MVIQFKRLELSINYLTPPYLFHRSASVYKQDLQKNMSYVENYGHAIARPTPYPGL